MTSTPPAVSTKPNSEKILIANSCPSTPPMPGTPTMAPLGHNSNHSFPLHTSMPCTPPLAPADGIPLAAYDLSYANNIDTCVVGSYRGIEPFATYRAPATVPASFVPPRGMIPTGIYSKFHFKGKFTMTHPSQTYGASPSKAMWSNIPDCHNNRAIAQTAPQTQVLHSRDDICLHN